MDSLSNLVFVFFVLSMVVERITEFLRQWGPFLKLFGFKNTTQRTLSKFEEQKRSFRNLQIAIPIGIFVATLLRADVFTILNSKPEGGVSLGWEHLAPGASVAWSIIGCLITGFFISFGSKLWHDVLDIIMEIKRAKATISTGIAKDFFTLGPNAQFDLLNAAIKDNGADWKANFTNYQGVAIAQKTKEGLPQGYLALQFNVAKKDDGLSTELNKVPETFFYNGYSIPTDIVESAKPKSAFWFTPVGEAPKLLGGSIEREATSITGTLGCRVEMPNGKLYGVSCYHVLFPNELKSNITKIENSAQVLGSSIVRAPSATDCAPQSGDKLGFASLGQFNQFLDIAFFESSSDEISEASFESETITGFYFVKKTDEKTLQVKFNGRSSGHQVGLLDAVSAWPDVTYFDDEPGRFKHEFQSILRLHIVADEGDSGAAVLNSNNELVGIIVAVGSPFAYAIPTRYLTNNYSFTFK